MKITTQTRVFIKPINAAFPQPVQPAYSSTVFLGNVSPINLNDATGVESNASVGCVHARPLFVPHNNYVTGEVDVFQDYTWWNGNLKQIHWTKDEVSSRMKYMGDNALTPYVKSLWTRDRARAIYYGHTMTDLGTPSPRYNYDPQDSKIQLTTETLKTQGVYLRLGVVMDSFKQTWQGTPGSYYSNELAPAEGDPRPFYWVQIKVDTEHGMNPLYYTVKFRQQGSPEVYKSSTEGDLGSKIFETAPNSNLASVAGSPNYGYFGYYGWSDDAEGIGQLFEIKLMGGMLFVNWGGAARAIEIPHTLRDSTNPKGDKEAEPAIYITRVRVRAEGIRSLYSGISPMMWLTEGDGETSDSDLGFVPVNTPTPVVHYAFAGYGLGYTRNAVAGTTVEITPLLNDGGPNSRVRIGFKLKGTKAGTYNGVDYAKATAMVRAVSLKFKEQVREPFGIETQIYPESIRTTESLDFDNLKIDRSASMTFNNMSWVSKLVQGAPDYFWGQVLNSRGAVAVAIEVKKEYYTEKDEFIDSTDWFRLFTGYGDLQSVVTIDAGGISKYQMICHDRVVSFNSPQFALPWADGWNIFAAAAYYANLGGVKQGDVLDSDLNFIQYVPPTPYEDYGSPEGPAYFLGQGTGGSPLFKPQPGQTPWQNLDRIGKQAGYLRYFDRYGKFSFEKFELHSTTLPYRIFSIVDNVKLGVYGVHDSAIFSGSVNRDLTTVRNRVTLIGIDAYGPLWNPIVAHRSDEDSIYTPANDVFEITQANNIGMPMGFVWIDSQFANTDYASSTADAIFDLVRYPSITGRFTSWLQPDLLVGQRLGFDDVRTGSYDAYSGNFLEFMLVGLTHEIQLGSAATTSMQCRFIPPGT